MTISTLNNHQKQAVEYSSGSLIVLAGPGSGKTKVLTHKIAHILNNSFNERFKILALTFTNKAADEMKQRVEKLVNDTKTVSRVFVGTFHSFAYKTLKSYGSYIGIPSDFIIYDKKEDLYKILFDGIIKYIQKERTGETKEIILSEKYYNTALLEKDISKIFYKIEKIKNQIFTTNDFSNSYLYSPEIGIILEIYEKELKKYKALDFSDLLLKTIQLFREKPFLKKDYQKIYKHILVDEGQDTNKVQFELLKLLCNDTCDELFIVADEDQVIYEWNDARFEHLLKLQKMYDAEIIQLNETYRCPTQIIDAANNLIKNNKSRLSGKHLLKTIKQNGKKAIEVNQFQTNENEIDFIQNKILDINDYNSCAIISRNRKILESIEEIFNKNNIPTYSPSLQDKFVSREINLLMYALKSIVNEDDKIAIFNLCQFYSFDYDMVSNNDNITLLQQFIDVFDKDKPLIELISNIRNDKDNFFKHLDSYTQKINIKEESSVKEDTEALRKYYRKFKQSVETESLSNFLNFVTLSRNNKITEKGIALLTGHAAKGLEFDYVFLVAMNEGIFPDFRAKGKALEEERRNCYVAITRTKKKLFLSYTNLKNTREGFINHQPSRFIKEMKLEEII
ncbi:MAG: ATP-dependent helicase [Bacteroidetes bacterium]|jgi:DNA helicase II / ATP-dependent DNA helicase PcrA|nr:ATP-dependent helicase [Bacteroidota bacterium]MBT6688084.1 ATP-dependent helicase [Bacteroidota bacterium]MBT7142337.1 ATP-dependent helicase [Bacteroidota bacterium]MBT7491151.1 ATP-dependent helicase [Bacteroidota bacterium]